MLFQNRGYMKKAKESYLESKKIYEEINNNQGLSLVLSNLISVSCELGEYSKVEEAYNECMKLQKIVQIRYNQSFLHIDMLRMYLSIDDIIKASQQLDFLIEISNREKIAKNG